MRFLHTSDLHLGKMLKNHRRDEAFGQFLGWLKKQLAERRVDVLLIAGDVFDVNSPPNVSRKQFYDFLVQARTQP
ncbi:MAG: metallophosphoesterase, partial [Duodenibacillus sp.]|nr:metallophosphoesterase [Duodenibacillus sp.]